MSIEQSTEQPEQANSRFVAFRFDEPAADMRGMHVLAGFGSTHGYSAGVYIAVRGQAEPAIKQLQKEGVPFLIRDDIDTLGFPRTGEELAQRPGWRWPDGREAPPVPPERLIPPPPLQVPRHGILRWILGPTRTLD